MGSRYSYDALAHLIASVTTIDELKPDKKNARKRTERSSSLIGESLRRYGAARSIVIDEDNRIIAGNGTIEEAKAAGIKPLRIIETDGKEIIAIRRTGLSEDDKVGLAIADNRTSDLSEWDGEMLRQLDSQYDLEPWFTEDEIPIEDEYTDTDGDGTGDDPTTHTVTFTVSVHQMAIIDSAVKHAIKVNKGAATDEDGNEEGNAITYICDYFFSRFQ